MPAQPSRSFARTTRRTTSTRRATRGITIAALAFGMLVGACSPSAASPSGAATIPSVDVPATPRASIGPVEFQAALCAAVDAYMLGYGNPETANTSDVWKAMEAGVEQADPIRVDDATTVILAHMAASRAAIKRSAGYEPGAAAMAELDASAAAIEAYVTEVRAARGNKDEVVKLAPTLGQAWPPFLSWMRLLGEVYASGALTVNVPCPPDAPRG